MPVSLAFGETFTSEIPCWYLRSQMQWTSEPDVHLIDCGSDSIGAPNWMFASSG